MLQAAEELTVLGKIKTFTKTDIDYTIEYETGEFAKLTLLNDHVFRFYMSPTGNFSEYPTPRLPTHEAKINAKRVQDYDVEAFNISVLKDDEEFYLIFTGVLEIKFLKADSTLIVHDTRVGEDVIREMRPISYGSETKQTLKQHPTEQCFGGGMQNGRFNHKGELIHIVNTNDWVDGGVTSPCPFYWTSLGYGVLRNTWQDGHYDFGTKSIDIIETVHEESHFDAFYFINPIPQFILSDYYELTGQPILMPEYAFYEAHLNTFNRDYWVEVEAYEKGAIYYEDGKYYRRLHPNQINDKEGILESLNGEKNNYQFSARAMIDRYISNDMPLGWFIPNDGYGSGYGQTDSLNGDIENLKEFVNYANSKGVEVGLWTESNLKPEDPDCPKKGERDLSEEVATAGIVLLKCDVAWVGEGYSFGLNAAETATNIFINKAKNKERPMILMVDGWAGIHRYSGIWTGDQVGGKWEYVRFHIPTYIGAGLSGIPVLGSDMDGIYGGEDREVNIRDYQWKSFTPIQLNMDGWGNRPKTPFSFDNEAIAINRAYLKFKSMMLPYNYTIAHSATEGLPMVRAMLLEFPFKKPAYTTDSQYQYMWGPFLLIAPIYKKDISIGNEIVRNGVFLPDRNQVWIELFTGEKYQGGKIYNNVKAPLWKLPVFVKDGAIIPFVNANNNPNEVQRDRRIITVYPNEETYFEVYEDDGKTTDYLQQNFAKTIISSLGPKSNEEGYLHLFINKTEGEYHGMVKERTTILQVMTTTKVKFVKSAMNAERMHLDEVDTLEDFEKLDNVYYFDKKFLINPYLKDVAKVDIYQKCLLIKIEKTDITQNDINVSIAEYANESEVLGSVDMVDITLTPPENFTVVDTETTPTSITLKWDLCYKVSYYEIERDGTIFSNILGGQCTFHDLKYGSGHSFRIRYVDDDVASQWSTFVLADTKENPYLYAVTGVKVACSVPCQERQEVSNLTNSDKNSVWHTDRRLSGQADFTDNRSFTLSFNLDNVYNIEKIEYVPREDGGTGTLLKVQFKYSANGYDWSRLSPIIDWKDDGKTKAIHLQDARMKYLELIVLHSVFGYGSGRQVLFYKKH